MKIVLNSTIVVSIALLYGRVLLPFLQKNFDISLLVESILLCLTLFTAMPFFWPILFGRPNKSSLYMETSFEKAQRLHVGITICRFLVGVLLLSFTIGQFSYIAAASSLLILGLLILFGPLIKKSETLYHRLEKGFMDNLNNDKN